MYIAGVKAAFIEALRATFDTAYPIKKMRGIHVHHEFPEAEADYPGVWVSYTPDPEVRSVGINHKEVVVEPDGEERLVRRWYGSGTVMLTVHAFTALQRDLMLDELLRVVAFFDSHLAIKRFHDKIQSNDFIAINAKWDTAVLMGLSESRGTPWGSDDMVYEGTVAIDIECSYVPERLENGGGLIHISRIIAKGSPEGQPKPVFDEPGVDTPGDDESGWV